MKIIKYGYVKFTVDGPKIEEWLVEREPEDPAEATTEQLLLAYAIHWAKEQFDAAMKSTTMQWLRDAALKKIAEQQAHTGPVC